MKAGKIIGGILAGIAAGAVLGFLFAPDKGSETRKKISKKGEDLAADLKRRFHDFVDGLASRSAMKDTPAGQEDPATRSEGTQTEK